MLRTHDELTNNKVKLTFVTVPFSGHFNSLRKLAQEMAMHNNQFDITLLVTGWSDISINEQDKRDLSALNINIVELKDDTVNSSQPMSFTFPRVAALTDQVITHCQNSDYIIYDFFALEGYIAGKSLGIPSICSIPAIMGPFDPANKLLIEGKNKNKQVIEALEKKYGIEINNKLEMISDGFLLPSDYKNIQWSWPTFTMSTNYQANRQVKHYQFMRPQQTKNHSDSDLVTYLKSIQHKKKIIYVSLGTVVTQNLWEQVPEVRQFIKKIFNNIKEKFQDSDKYEVVIATGRDCHEVISDIPGNFHVYKHVSQPEILAVSDVFITHAGGNSVNEAIDAETPMVALPFFGDQHLCANNIEKTMIGVSFLTDDNELAVDTTSGLDERKSLNDPNAIWNAIENIIDNKQYKNAIQTLKRNQLTDTEQFEKMLINDKTLAWQEGDLLYGCNGDRIKLAELTGRNDFFRLCDTSEFHHLFNDINNIHSLPRIIDQYHDVLTLNKISAKSKFNDYDRMLAKYQQHIQAYLEQLKSIRSNEKEKHDEIIWNMCVAGLNFFIKEQKKTIHFVIGQYNDHINRATTHELAWIKSHWSDEVVRNKIKFYNIKNGKLFQVDPLQTNWFLQRPTPSLDDIAPDKLNKNAWQSSMQLIRESKPHLFFNRLPKRYEKELATLKSSGISVIDINKAPDLAKKSLSSGEVHIFTIQEDGTVAIAKRITDHALISHAVVANNEAVRCAGEVRLRPICVNGKWLKAIDLSNRSGHYRPGASTLTTAIKAFEAMGYIVHRVNAVREYIPSTLSNVEDEMPAFNSITKAACV